MLNRNRIMFVLLTAVLLLSSRSAFAGSRWMYCRYQTNVNNVLITYLSEVVRVNLQGSDTGYDLATSHIVLRNFRDTVRQRYGFNDGGEPYCFVPLKDGPSDQAVTLRADDVRRAQQIGIKIVTVSNWP